MDQYNFSSEPNSVSQTPATNDLIVLRSPSTVPVLIGDTMPNHRRWATMDSNVSIRREFRKWWARNYYELLDSVVMFYLGMVLLLVGMAIFESFKG